MSHDLIYAWPDIDGYMVQHLVPDGKVVLAAPGESGAELASRVPSVTKRLWMHVDVSRPGHWLDDRGDFVERMRRRAVTVVNGGVQDITKPTIAKVCDAIGAKTCELPDVGPRDQLVVRKTVWNAGGMRERELGAEVLLRLGYPREEIRSGLARAPGYERVRRHELRANERCDGATWIERFVDNDRGAFWRAYCLFDRLVIVEAEGTGAFKKVSRSQIVRRAMVSHGDRRRPKWLPEQLAAIIERLQVHMRLDYGTLDVVADDSGEPVVIDVNATPYWGATTQNTDPLAHRYYQSINHLRNARALS